MTTSTDETEERVDSRRIALTRPVLNFHRKCSTRTRARSVPAVIGLVSAVALLLHGDGASSLLSDPSFRDRWLLASRRPLPSQRRTPRRPPGGFIGVVRLHRDPG